MEILFFLGFFVVVYFLYFKKDKGGKRLSGSSKTSAVKVSGIGSQDDDDFATFTISVGLDEEKSTNSTPGRWADKSEIIDFKGTEIVGGNFYIGGRLKSLDGYSTESSLIDDSLEIITHPYTYQDESLGYWPSYISLSPSCRGAYISWLASDRCSPDVPLGYVFMYFYGMERLVTCDDIDNIEYSSIFDEIKRLKGVYGGNRSFSNYSSALLDLMCIQRPSVVSLPKSVAQPESGPLFFKHQLASAVNEGTPINGELAFSWLKFHPEYSFKTPARRCEREFFQLFNLRYEHKHGNGIIVKPNKTRLKIDYFPASSSLRGLSIAQSDLPDPSMLKGRAISFDKHQSCCIFKKLALKTEFLRSTGN